MGIKMALTVRYFYSSYSILFQSQMLLVFKCYHNFKSVRKAPYVTILLLWSMLFVFNLKQSENLEFVNASFQYASLRQVQRMVFLTL